MPRTKYLRTSLLVSRFNVYTEQRETDYLSCVHNARGRGAISRTNAADIDFGSNEFPGGSAERLEHTQTVNN